MVALVCSALLWVLAHPFVVAKGPYFDGVTRTFPYRALAQAPDAQPQGPGQNAWSARMHHNR